MQYNLSDNIKNMKPSAIREIFKSLGTPGAISFAAGNPSPESFPAKELSDISADIFAHSSTAALQYSITEGYTPLREEIAKRQQNKFGIGATDDSTMIVSGGQQGIELACKVFCNEGDKVICENPSSLRRCRTRNRFPRSYGRSGGGGGTRREKRGNFLRGYRCGSGNLRSGAFRRASCRRIFRKSVCLRIE